MDQITLKINIHLKNNGDPKQNLFYVISQLSGKSLSSSEVSRKEVNYYKDLLVLSSKFEETRELALCLLLIISYDFFEQRRISTLPSAQEYYSLIRSMPISDNRKVLKVIIISNKIRTALNI